MRVKAKVSFGGQYAMYKGTEADLPDNPVSRALVKGGFIEEVTEPAAEPEPAVPAEPEKDAEEPEATEPDLHRLRKDDLLKICEERGIEVDKKATKEDLIKAIEAQE